MEQCCAHSEWKNAHINDFCIVNLHRRVSSNPSHTLSNLLANYYCIRMNADIIQLLKILLGNLHINSHICRGNGSI